VGKITHTGLALPFDLVTDDDYQKELDYILNFFADAKAVTDRPVRNGDTVNIDFVGSIDGVEFPNGSTGGMGTEVTIGETDFIDDFLDQLIGHSPGDTVNVNVTFPDFYPQAPELQNKRALFVTDINFIVEMVKPELTDGFVEEFLSQNYGVNNVDELMAELKAHLTDKNTRHFVNDYLYYAIEILSMPDSVLNRTIDIIINDERLNAERYGYTFEEYLTLNNYNDIEELKEAAADFFFEEAAYSLVIQAIAEETGIKVMLEDVDAHFFDNFNGMTDYSEYVEIFGMPYIKKIVLTHMVMSHIMANAVYADAAG
jgi:trigger factor